MVFGNKLATRRLYVGTMRGGHGSIVSLRFRHFSQRMQGLLLATQPSLTQRLHSTKTDGDNQRLRCIVVL